MKKKEYMPEIYSFWLHCFLYFDVDGCSTVPAFRRMSTCDIRSWVYYEAWDTAGERRSGGPE